MAGNEFSQNHHRKRGALAPSHIFAYKLVTVCDSLAAGKKAHGGPGLSHIMLVI